MSGEPPSGLRGRGRPSFGPGVRIAIMLYEEEGQAFSAFMEREGFINAHQAAKALLRGALSEWPKWNVLRTEREMARNDVRMEMIPRLMTAMRNEMDAIETEMAMADSTSERFP